MDFFSAAPVRSHSRSERDGAPTNIATSMPDDVDEFAQAIAGRFSGAAGRAPLLTARLSPVPPPPVPTFSFPFPPPTPSASSPLSKMTLATPPPIAKRREMPPLAPSTETFTAATAQTVVDILKTSKVLVLDTRAHSAFSTARLPRAISLSVPSTLLKLPAFTLQKLSTMLSNSTASSRFNMWRSASRILVYDGDTSVLHEGSPLLGLLRKFRAEGFEHDLAWLQGGIQGL